MNQQRRNWLSRVVDLTWQWVGGQRARKQNDQDIKTNGIKVSRGPLPRSVATLMTTMITQQRVTASETEGCPRNNYRTSLAWRDLIEPLHVDTSVHL
jgi:hypothetical protein